MSRDILATKWDRRMHEWMLWFEGRGPSISCAYEDRIPTGRKPAGPEECIATNAALERLRLHGRTGRQCHEAILTYTRNIGTRGEQAARLGVHPDTYRARVRAAMALLEILIRNRSTPTRTRPLSTHAQTTKPKATRRNARHVKA